MLNQNKKNSPQIICIIAHWIDESYIYVHTQQNEQQQKHLNIKTGFHAGL